MAFLHDFLFTAPLAGRRWLALAALGALGTQCQPAAPTEQATTRPLSPDSLKLETAVASPLPKFDVESPILRQLALLPPAERSTSGQPMRQYQLLTRRFWLAQYSTAHLLTQAQAGQLNLPVFSQQLAATQGHWRVLREGLSQYGPFPPTMTSHLGRFREVEGYQQAALSDLQADCAAQRPPHLDAASAATQPKVAQLLAPLTREPKPLQVQLN